MKIRENTWHGKTDSSEKLNFLRYSLTALRHFSLFQLLKRSSLYKRYGQRLLRFVSSKKRISTHIFNYNSRFIPFQFFLISIFHLCAYSFYNVFEGLNINKIKVILMQRKIELKRRQRTRHLHGIAQQSKIICFHIQST